MTQLSKSCIVVILVCVRKILLLSEYLKDSPARFSILFLTYMDMPRQEYDLLQVFNFVRPPRFQVRDSICRTVIENLFWKDNIFCKIVINNRNLFQNIFLTPQIFFGNLFLNQKRFRKASDKFADLFTIYFAFPKQIYKYFQGYGKR